MKKNVIFLFVIFLFLSCSAVFDGLLKNNINEHEYIIFTSEGSSFSPVIVVEGEPEIEWIWDDGTTSGESSPVKEYGSVGTRTNKLNVNPWSSLVRINIGYDGGDGGSAEIEYVEDQNVSSVENLDVAAPWLKQWCSSYNSITELDFSNFVSIDTIECFYSEDLVSVDLTNTPELKRACFENCDLSSLDLSDCVKLEDLRGALNAYPTINFGSIGTDVWHICIRDNTQLTENLFADMANFPNIEELFIWRDNQSGELVIPSTGTTGTANIQIFGNDFIKVDLRGALQESGRNAILNLSNNNISEIYLDGCSQINNLNLRNNALDSSQVDYVLATIDSLGRTNGILNLTGNTSPSVGSSSVIASLEGKSWTVEVD